MSNTMIGDTPVIRISENANDNNALYIFYDHEKNVFVLRGKRNYESQDGEENWEEYEKKTTYSYMCRKKRNVIGLLHFLFVSPVGVTVDLLNYPDLPNYTEEITYYLLSNAYDVEFAATEEEYEPNHFVYNEINSFTYSFPEDPYKTSQINEDVAIFNHDVENLLNFIETSSGMFSSPNAEAEAGF
jgi:hypothetical protein